MQSIYKYELEISESQKISLPIDSRVLCVNVQNDNPKIWVLVPDINAKYSDRIFHVIGTGWISENIPGRYVGTFMLCEGRFVYHVFEGAI